MQLLPGLYQVGGSLNGCTWLGGYGNYEDANVYAVDTGQGLVLFDSGNGETLPQIDANLRRWNFCLKDVIACLVTHAHMDHAGGCAGLQARGAALYAHEKAALSMARGDEGCAGYLYHRAFPRCRVDHPLQGGESLCIGGLTIEALAFPGHSAGCMAYRFRWQDFTVVVSGDIIGTLLDGYFGWSGSWDFDRGVYLKSLAAFAKLDMDIMLPGHGLVYWGKPQVRVEDALNVALMEWRK